MYIWNVISEEYIELCNMSLSPNFLRRFYLWNNNWYIVKDVHKEIFFFVFVKVHDFPSFQGVIQLCRK